MKTFKVLTGIAIVSYSLIAAFSAAVVGLVGVGYSMPKEWTWTYDVLQDVKYVLVLLQVVIALAMTYLIVGMVSRFARHMYRKTKAPLWKRLCKVTLGLITVIEVILKPVGFTYECLNAVDEAL